MVTPKIFDKFKNISLTLQATNEVASNALPQSGGEISGNLNITGELVADLIGNASTATKLASAGTITLAGDATGSVDFDGTDATLTVTVVDDSHNHTVENIDNLETLLAAKSAIASPTFTGTPTAPTATAGTNTTQIATTAFVTTAVTNGTSSKVSGPASAVSGQIAVFDGTTGKVIKDSGFTIATSVPANAKFTDTTYTAASATPVVAGTGAVGTSTKYAREDHVHPAQTTVSGNAGTATTLKTARTIDGVSFNGSAAITHFGTCSTAAATAAKTVACTGFTLVTGAEITVQFTVTNTADNPTLNVNSTGAKAIVYRNAAITAGYLAANRCYRFVYDGTNYELVGDINIDTNNKVAQTITTTNAEYALLAMADASATATKTNGARFASGVTLNPSTSTITATTFKGALSGNASSATTAAACTGNAATATKLAASKNIALTGDVTGSAGFDGSAAASIAATLATSGVTAGSYGPSANATPAHSGTFSVPYITVDAKGRVTAASTKTITLPASGNTDTKVKQTVSTTNNTYPLLACATANATATVTGEAIFASAIKINPSAGSLTATAVYNAVWNDYAEFFPRGEETEAGDFVALSLDSDNEVYVKASKETSKSVGIHSDSFGHLIGGEDAPDGQDFVEYNLPKYIPVGLVGRVRANIVGEVKKGDFIVISDIPGVGRAFNKETDSYVDIIGMACESSSEKDIKRIKVKLGN